MARLPANAIANAPDVQAPAPAPALRAELVRVLASEAFVAAAAHQRLLRYLVEHRLAGDRAPLKESVLAIDVFQRPAASFDPAQDSIVRVEARRLRQRLARHYAGEGREAEWRIELPKGSYEPSFVRQVWLRDGREAEAAELVERGLYFLRQGHEEGHRKALARFEAAVRAAPAWPAAHAGVARAWLQLVATNIEPPQPGVTLALRAGHAALALDGRHAEALVLCAQLEQRFSYNWARAGTLFSQALQQAPQSAFVRHAHAFALMLRREFEAAEAELALARRLDPLHLGLRAHEALLQLYRRDWVAAEASLKALLDMSPDNVLGLSLLANVELLRGDVAASLVSYQRVQQLHPRLSIGWCGVAQALALAGRAAEARACMAELQQRWAGHYASPYQLAMVAWRLGDVNLALAWLARAVEERDPNAVCLPVDPCFDGLRGDAGFNALVQRVLGADAATRPA